MRFTYLHFEISRGEIRSLRVFERQAAGVGYRVLGACTYRGCRGCWAWPRAARAARDAAAGRLVPRTPAAAGRTSTSASAAPRR